MKTKKIFFIGMLLVIAGTLNAQVSLSVNLGSPPQWGPVGYSDARYYYLPDVEAYYDVQSSMFIYYNLGSWVHRRSLPTRYRNYDLYSGYKVVMSDYRGNTPYKQFKQHKSQYARGYHGQDQRSIGQRPESGNSRGRMPVRANSYNRNNQDRGQGSMRGGDNKMKKDNGRSRGNGKKK